MADNVERLGEADKKDTIAVAENHLPTIPKCVVIISVIMDGGIKPQAFIVNRVALEDVVIEAVGGTQPIIGFVDSWIGGRRISFASYQDTRQSCAMVAVIDGPAFFAG